MHDCGQIYFAACVILVFFVISGVSSNVRNLTSLPQSGGSRILLWITGMHSGCLEVKCFLCNRPCRRKIISTALLRRLQTSAMCERFSSFSLLYFFRRDRHRALQDSTATRQTRVKGLKRGFTRAFRNLSELQKRCEASETRLFFHVKFLVPLMHFEANNVHIFEIWKIVPPLAYFILTEFSKTIVRVIIFVLGNICQVTFALDTNDFYIFLLFFFSYLNILYCDAIFHIESYVLLRLWQSVFIRK